MKKAIYDNKPQTIEAVGNGSFYYRWDINPIYVQNEPMDGVEAEPAQKWECLEVTIWATLSANKITEAVIDALWGNGVEQKLLNDYNAYKMGVLGSEAEVAYKEFITKRNDLKNEVYAVCVDLGIERDVVTVDSAKSAKLRDIEVYDKSTAVNSFSVNNKQLWLSREDRVAILSRVTAEEASGLTTTSIWTNEAVPQMLTLTIEIARALLSQLELYAAACYDCTQQHIATVSAMDNTEALLEYDCTVGYPQQLTFTV